MPYVTDTHDVNHNNDDNNGDLINIHEANGKSPNLSANDRQASGLSIVINNIYHDQHFNVIDDRNPSAGHRAGSSNHAHSIHYSHAHSSDWRSRRGLSKTDSSPRKNVTNKGDQTKTKNRTSLMIRKTSCLRERSILCLLLTLATLWLGVFLYNFTKTPFLNASKRSLLADGALPVSVILASVVGSYLFVDVKLEHVKSENISFLVTLAQRGLDWPAILCSLPLGFLMSLLFFIDQAVVEGVVNYKGNRLKKSQAIHWDLFIIAIINIILAFLGLPLVQPSLPQTPLHVHALADLEDRVDQGKVNQKIISVRETRITALVTHLLIGATIALFEIIRWIPRPVLDGLLLYLAVTIMLRKNQLFDRVLLLVTEQASYPPTHYIRTVPQRIIHTFTCVQLIQLLALCCIAFSGVAYVQLTFPLLLVLLLPMRSVQKVERKFKRSPRWFLLRII